jgi:hypothetical protein
LKGAQAFRQPASFECPESPDVRAHPEFLAGAGIFSHETEHRASFQIFHDHGLVGIEMRKNCCGVFGFTALVNVQFPLTSNTLVASRVQFVLGRIRLVEVST